MKYETLDWNNAACRLHINCSREIYCPMRNTITQEYDSLRKHGFTILGYHTHVLFASHLAMQYRWTIDKSY